MGKQLFIRWCGRLGSQKSTRTHLPFIDKRFESLADMPLMGRPRNEIKEGYYSSDYKKYIISYLIQENYIEVLGVLHETMLPERHL
ncbi:type II toxin-antitoxin system RelE/ParE family toxin [Paraglaciecola sp. MB-3u-78]|nr:type II toxin-antitoxin system RelE/ParE family toxin [Paraglaciecola sp. MB-3u-78]